MQRTLIRRAQYGLESGGSRGVQPWRQRPSYETFKSKFGPEYKIGAHLYGVNMNKGANIVYLMVGFGGVAGIFALFFFNGVPRVQRDIMQKLPIVGWFFKHEVPPEDNPF